MEIKQLESYIAVVKYGSFTKAAEKLGISQPSISTHIQMLETELKTKLLNRHTKSIEVTKHGEELYECATNMLRLRDHFLMGLNDIEDKTIHLGCSTIPSAYVLPELLRTYKKVDTDVNFLISQGDSQDVMEGLTNGKYQVGLVGMTSNHEGICCVPFLKDRIVLIAPNTEEYYSIYQEYQKSLDKELLGRMLRKYPFIAREYGSGSRRYANQVLECLGIEEEQLDISARLNDSESIKNMVRNGIGISMISKKAVEECCKKDELLCFDIPGDVAERSLNIVYKKKEIYRAHEKQFVEFVLRYYGGR